MLSKKIFCFLNMNKCYQYYLISKLKKSKSQKWYIILLSSFSSSLFPNTNYKYFFILIKKYINIVFFINSLFFNIFLFLNFFFHFFYNIFLLYYYFKFSYSVIYNILTFHIYFLLIFEIAILINIIYKISNLFLHLFPFFNFQLIYNY